MKLHANLQIFVFFQLCEDLFQRAGQNSDPDLTYSVEVKRSRSVH